MRFSTPFRRFVTIAILLAVAAPAYAADPPLAHWRFDEGTGTTITDEIDDVIGNFMTPNPTWSTDVPTVSFTNTHSLQFSGLGDGVSIAWPSGYDFTSTEPRSFSFWYKPLGDEENDATSHYNRIISCSNDRCEFAGTFGDISVHRLAFYDGDWRDTGFNMTVGTWYNIMFTYDGTTVKLYVSGTEEFSDASSGRAVSGTMYIGVRHTGNEGINGRVDDFRVYNYALSPSQVSNIVAGSDNPDAAPAPTLSGALVPADGATNVNGSANLVMTFNRTVQGGTGNILIKKTSDNSTIETISTNGSKVTGSGTRILTINPSTTLSDSTSYYVQVQPNAIRSGSGAFYAGIADTTSWNFTTGDFTAPNVSSLSPADDATDVSTTANLNITFDQVTRVSTGSLTIKKSSDNSTVETITVSGALLSGNGTTELTLNPTTTLDEGTSYYIVWEANAFKDASGNHAAAVTSATTWNFTTLSASSSSSSSSSLSPSQGGGGGRGARGAALGGNAAPVRRLSSSVSRNANASPDTTMSVPFRERTCSRISKWFSHSHTMRQRVNIRLMKRFGFECQP